MGLITMLLQLAARATGGGMGVRRARAEDFDGPSLWDGADDTWPPEPPTPKTSG